MEQTQRGTIAMAGNPNVGKSTLFNALTGMKQHTGNWPGKTVSSAQGFCTYAGRHYRLVDIPGTYSLMAHSAEEEVARDCVCFGGSDVVAVVCDAACLERNLNLALQAMEISPRVVVCVNLLDEARKKGLTIDLALLSERLGVPVAGTSARSGEGIGEFMEAVEAAMLGTSAPKAVRYPEDIEQAIADIEPLARELSAGRTNSRWLALRLLEGDEALLCRIDEYLDGALKDTRLAEALAKARERLSEQGISPERLHDEIVSALVNTAQEVCDGVVRHSRGGYDAADRRLDRILTGRLAGFPVMLVMLGAVLWLTVTGANYPSQLLAEFFAALQQRLSAVFIAAGAPEWLHGIVVLGAYRVLAWVVAVMLPPMAIFFPLFTLLEDSGYLPRVAYNLDRPFQRCRACGKQALTMCMGLGCNAVGVTGCRIIDSPRERMLAILTNCFIPCNGRFPTLIAVITMFFAGGGGLLPALLLTGVIVLGVGVTLAVTRLLSDTLLRGAPSSFTLELPPYRMPQIGRVLVRSMLDRTLFVLGRAVVVALPAGAVIWLAANIDVGTTSLLCRCADLLEPFARLLGLDGEILIAFILGLPANEIVLPIAIMTYTAQGSLGELGGLAEMRALLINNGWTQLTAASMLLFCLMHWPCSTTLLTIKKETGSWYWTLLAFLIPTVLGIAVCFIFATAVRAFA